MSKAASRKERPERAAGGGGMHDSLSPVGDPLGWHGSCTELAMGEVLVKVGGLGLVGWGSKRHNIRDSHSGGR